MLYQRSRHAQSPLERKKRRTELSKQVSDERIMSLVSGELSVEGIAQECGLSPNETATRINRLLKKGHVEWNTSLIPNELYSEIHDEIFNRNTTSIKKLSAALEGRAERYQIRLVITSLKMRYKDEWEEL
ncbi:MAG: helix-turn-helix domain-containing protein [Chitinivibrionales bacterium]